MKFGLALALLVVFVAQAYSLHTEIGPKEDFCLYKNVSEGQKLNINYVSSGYEEQKIMLKVYDLGGKVIKEVLKQREANVDITATATGAYRMCWRSMDNRKKTLSFSLTLGDQTKKQSGDNLDQVSEDVRKAYKSLEQIFRNQHYQHTREGVHRTAIDALESKIQWCAVIKILVLIVIGVVQVYILTGYFKARKEFTV